MQCSLHSVRMLLLVAVVVLLSCSLDVRGEHGPALFYDTVQGEGYMRAPYLPSTVNGPMYSRTGPQSGEAKAWLEKAAQPAWSALPFGARTPTSPYVLPFDKMREVHDEFSWNYDHNAPAAPPQFSFAAPIFLESASESRSTVTAEDVEAMIPALEVDNLEEALASTDDDTTLAEIDATPKQSAYAKRGDPGCKKCRTKGLRNKKWPVVLDPTTVNAIDLPLIEELHNRVNYLVEPKAKGMNLAQSVLDRSRRVIIDATDNHVNNYDFGEKNKNKLLIPKRIQDEQQIVQLMEVESEMEAAPKQSAYAKRGDPGCKKCRSKRFRRKWDIILDPTTVNAIDLPLVQELHNRVNYLVEPKAKGMNLAQSVLDRSRRVIIDATDNHVNNYDFGEKNKKELLIPKRIQDEQQVVQLE